MKEKYLPIGSVVLLKNAEKRVMVTGFCCLSLKDENKIYDYCGCLYPEGVMNASEMLLFNHDDISDISSLGYCDKEGEEFLTNFRKISSSLEKNLSANRKVEISNLKSNIEFL